MVLINRMSFAAVALLSVVLGGCDRKTTGSPEISSYNKEVDPETLGYFSLPKVDDPSLRHMSEIPSGNYFLTMIQSYTISHSTKISAAFEQKLRTAAEPRVGDLIRFDSFRNGNTESQDYKIAAQLNLPLNLSANSGTFTFGSVREYWNQVFTSGQREWALNTRANATAINPSIEETFKHPTDRKGVFSYTPFPSMKNTVFLTIENSRLYVYLKTQFKDETSYIRLEYTDDLPLPPAGLEKPDDSMVAPPSRAATSELTLANPVLGLPLTLETIPGGEGNPSIFGSDSQGSISESKTTMQTELEQINALLSIIETNLEIRNKITENTIEGIVIANPYKSKWLKHGIFINEIGKATLILRLGMTEGQILEALETYIGTEKS